MSYLSIKLLDDQINEKQKHTQQLKESISTVNDEIFHLGEVMALLKQSKSHKIELRKTFILDIINKAISDIVHDKEIKVDIVSSEGTGAKYNIVYDFVIFKNGIEIARNNNVFDTTGGGVISIISFILKIMMGYINTGNKFYIFDESFSQLSVNYLSALSMFLRKLCEDYGFTLLMITHNELYEYAHVHYDLNVDESDRLKIMNTNIKESETFNIKNNFYRLQAKYFQSIKNIQIDIKGLTVLTGPSDIGKSAIMRSINSIILNDFKATYESNFRKRGKYTEIILSKHIDEDNFDFIKMKYKQGTVYYYLQDGTEYKGKSLANDKIVELLETFGFKRVDTSIYKNWSSNLKIQTERVFVTTQYDTSYFSSEKNATEKLLTLLFNSHMFNDAISTIDSDIRAKELSIKDITQAIEFEEQELLRLFIKKSEAGSRIIDSYEANINNIIDDNNIKIEQLGLVDSKLLILNKLINDYNNIDFIDSYELLLDNSCNFIILLGDVESSVSVITQIVEKLNKLNTIDEYINTVNNCNLNIDEYNKSINIIHNDDSILKSLIDETKKVNLIQTYINSNEIVSTNSKKLKPIENDIKIINSTIIKLTELISVENALNTYESSVESAQHNIQTCTDRLNLINSNIKLIENNIAISDLIIVDQQNIHAIDNLINLDNSIKSSTNIIININNDIRRLDEKYNLHKCKECGGIGYVYDHKDL